jgi:ABC-type bacteriocin/lantibiotic exporter with double-glycine peptidase domain
MEPIIAQRRDTDCAVAVIGWYFHMRYEDAYVAAVTVEPNLLKNGGLSVVQIQTVASRLGRKLKRLHWSKVDLEEDCGILIVNWNEPKRQNGSYGHCVVLRRGTIICPRLPAAYDADEYLALENGRVGTLLVEG